MPEQIKQFNSPSAEGQKSLNYLFADKQRDVVNVEKEGISDKEVEGKIKLAKQKLFTALNDDYFFSFETIIKIKEEFGLSEVIVKEMANQSFIKLLSCGNYHSVDNAIGISKKFNIPDAIIQQAAKETIIELFEAKEDKGRIDDISYIINELNVSEKIINSPEIQKLAERDIRYCLSRNCLYDYPLYDAAKIKNSFNLSEEKFQEAAKQSIINELVNGYIDDALEIKNEFKLIVSLQELIQRIPALTDLINKISELAPEFRVQVEKSDDLVMEVCRFINDPDQLINIIKENPHLIDAITNNSRFSSRLLIKYPEFDEDSKENIEKLYSVKKKIMDASPEMDPESLEFRQLMQEGLKDFKNNPEIIEEIKKQGINLDEWLNYDKTSYFNLSTGGSEIAFSEQIRTPIDRIKETIDSYAHILKSVFKEYRPEMEKFEIVLEDAGFVNEQIVKMEAALEQARVDGNEKKAQGIERGLTSQREKLNNLKKGMLWDKLLGEIAAFQRLKNDCFDAQNKLLEAEKKLDQALSGKTPSGKMIQDIKKAITSSKEELIKKLNDLEKRIEEFKTELSELVLPCLGEDRSTALIQEINQKMAEQFNHFDSDRTDLANLFSERGDKETAQLESRPMSIFVWARNPDIDLYQGNYSPCCICIDSAHMGAESTISDYNTDLGIQIINIWDETKNEPVTAAWCWLGVNEKGEKALVVDNIESNTLYSSNFSEQLTKELFDYIKEYAKKIGADKVVLGKANNDLPTASQLAKLNDDGNEYEKIGGTNRIDDYFLEAEDKSVKLLWIVEEEKVSKKSAKQKEVSKIKFKNLQVNSINENNLDKILQAERKIYASTGLISGQILAEDIRNNNGFEYSLAIVGVRPGKKSAEIVAYIAAVEDETDEGDSSIYLEDIAVLPEAQGQGIGWEAMKELISKIKVKAQKDNKPILLDMHLRENSQAFIARHKEDLESLGVRLIEEALVPDYYDEGEDALYQVYEVK